MRMHIPLQTWIRIMTNLERCKVRLAPSWANAAWASAGLFLPSLMSALGDGITQQHDKKAFEITLSMAFAGVFLVALILSVLAYRNFARVENASIHPILDEMKEILDTWTVKKDDGP